jgi:ArsR family transcriptional regulator, arsenate/arsenite/antimonite-responsive transcriptional repressor
MPAHIILYHNFMAQHLRDNTAIATSPFATSFQEMSIMAVTTRQRSEAGAKNTTESAASEKAIREIANVFTLLSDETRLRILSYLAQDEELHVSALCERLGQSQPAVSHHLALLRVSGLIEPRRDGKHVFYRVRMQFYPVERMTSGPRTFFV